MPNAWSTLQLAPFLKITDFYAKQISNFWTSLLLIVLLPQGSCYWKQSRRQWLLSQNLKKFSMPFSCIFPRISKAEQPNLSSSRELWKTELTAELLCGFHTLWDLHFNSFFYILSNLFLLHFSQKLFKPIWYCRYSSQKLLSWLPYQAL